MRIKEVERRTSDLAFDLFHSFARFEFALKEADWLVSKVAGVKAKPNWNSFVEHWETTYQPSIAALALVKAEPQIQCVAANGGLEFVSPYFDEGTSAMRRVVDLCHIVRNNLFHGGKHDLAGWNSSARIAQLAPLVVAVLGEIAEHAGIDGDFIGAY